MLAFFSGATFSFSAILVDGLYKEFLFVSSFFFLALVGSPIRICFVSLSLNNAPHSLSDPNVSKSNAPTLPLFDLLEPNICS